MGGQGQCLVVAGDQVAGLYKGGGGCRRRVYSRLEQGAGPAFPDDGGQQTDAD